jgi:hypothetical protein
MARAAVFVLVAAVAAVSASVAASGPTPTVVCEDIIGLGGADPAWRPKRIVLSVIAAPPAYMGQIQRQEGRWTFWRKAGLVVRGDSPPVRVSVPKAWRTRAAIGWGSVRETAALRVDSCPPSGELGEAGDWNPYAGGFSVRRPACVPVTFRVGTRERTVRFGIGKRCR